MPADPNEMLPSWPLTLTLIAVYLCVAPLVVLACRRSLPPHRERAIPWSGLEVATAFLINQFIVSVIAMTLILTGLGAWLYGDALQVRALSPGAEPVDRLIMIRLGLLATVLALPVQMLLMIQLVRVVSQTQLYQLGLTAHRLRQNMQLGVLGWMLITPPVLALNVLVIWSLSHVSASSLTDHPFTKLSQGSTLAPAEWLLLILAATVVAPLTEEFFFRGLLQGWLTRQIQACHATLGVSLGVALWYRAEEIRQLFQQGDFNLGAVLGTFAPVLFFLMLGGPYLLLLRRARDSAWPAIFSAAAFFAAMHSFAWPSPVGLFVLALGLGWLTARTRSLVGPIVCHALFNGVACVELLLSTL